jgi:hypothetical protein
MVASLTGCGRAPLSSPNTPEGAAGTAAAFTDPFAYCAAVGTSDSPAPPYAGPTLPDSVIAGLKKALDMPDDVPAEVLQNGTFWRCMNGKVYACFVGANLPCEAKANTDRTPTQALMEFCQQNPDADVVPMVVTGHDTVYEWRCNNDQPEIVRQFAEADERGFVSNIWYEIAPQ